MSANPRERPDVADAFSRPAPTLVQLPEGASFADLARAYGTLCAIMHAERRSFIEQAMDTGKRLVSIDDRLSALERRSAGGVSRLAFGLVCLAASVAITSTFWLVLRH